MDKLILLRLGQELQAMIRDRLPVYQSYDSVTDILDKLKAIQQRRLVTELCRQTSHGRAWFYRALEGHTSVLQDLPVIDALLAKQRCSIAEMRDRAGLSQAKLAARLGTTRQTISMWEKHPTPERVRRVQAALGTVDTSSGDNRP